jgi:hypothetical protein
MKVEDMNFHVPSSVIASHYHVSEYFRSAVFLIAIQAHDLHTWMEYVLKL